MEEQRQKLRQKIPDSDYSLGPSIYISNYIN